MAKVLFLLSLLCLLGCIKSKIPCHIVAEDLSDSLHWIDSWQLLGPFYSDSICSKSPHAEDFLEKYGYSENDLEAADFITCGNKFLEVKSVSEFKRVDMPMHGLYLDEIYPSDCPGSVYLGCILHSSVEQEVAFLFTSYQKGKLWLNGDLIYQSKWKSTRTKYREEFVNVRLLKGQNFVVFKVSISEIPQNVNHKRWRFDFCMTSVDRALKLYNVVYNHSFLGRTCIDTKELHLYVGPYSRMDYSVSLLEKNRDIQLRKKETKEMDGHITVMMPDTLVPELYTCCLLVGEDTLRERFFFGNIDSTFSSLYSQCYKMNLSKSQKINLETFSDYYYAIFNRRRLQSHESQSEYWDRNKVNVINELNKVRTSLVKKEDPFKKGIGMFRYYNCLDEDSLYYYTTYFSEYSGRVPLFIHLFIDAEGYNVSWLKHWQNHLDREYLKALSKELQFGYILTNCGGSNDSKTQRAHLAEIVKQAIETLPVDPERIFIIGNCASTMVALDFFINGGHKIAGVGFVNPNFRRSYYSLCASPGKSQQSSSLYVLCSLNDEIFPVGQARKFYNLLKTNYDTVYWDISYETTHNLSPPYYGDKMYRTLINSVKSE